MSRSARLWAFCFFTCISMVVGAIIAESGEPAKTASSDVRSRYMRVVPGDYLWLLSNEEAIMEEGGPFADLLQQLREGKVPTEKEAERKAFAHALQGAEWATVSGLVKSGVDLPGFASRGDLIWIVRIGGNGVRSYKEVWISSSTAEEKCLFPVDTPG